MAVLVEYYSEREVLILLKDLVRHANHAGPIAVEENIESLESTIESVVKNASDFRSSFHEKWFLGGSMIALFDHFYYIASV